MAQMERLVQEYYSRHGGKIIDCPFQPGNLKISEKACFKRHVAARRKEFEAFKVEDLFNYFVAQGLSRCQQCPIINNLTS